MRFNKILVLILVLLITSSIVYSAEQCDLPTIKKAFKKAYYNYLDDPTKAYISAQEVRDLSSFYNDFKSGKSVSCNDQAKESGVMMQDLVDKGFNLEVIIPFCADGTEYGECAVKKPKYCFNGKLVERCDLCGCSADKECTEEKVCKAVKKEEIKKEEVAPEEQVSPPEVEIPEIIPNLSEENLIQVNEEVPKYVEGEIIVKFKDEKDIPSSLNSLAPKLAKQKEAKRRERLDLDILKELNVKNGEKLLVGKNIHFKNKGLDRLHKLELNDDETVEQAVARLKDNPLVEYVEPDYMVSIQAIPNDPEFWRLYGLHSTASGVCLLDADIDAPEAWDIYTGTTPVAVGVIDTGVNYSHPDLAANMWRNPNEIEGNGLDDDANGYIDDIYGWDFRDNDNDPRYGGSYHGTHVSGTIAAVGNNNIGVIGVAGPTSNIKIMALRFSTSQGGSTTALVAAIEYATMMGAGLTSNSYGGNDFSQAKYDAISAANDAGVLFVAAAGNAGSNNDITPFYPSSYDLPNIIAVAATNQADLMPSFSNYGATKVDLGAPGDKIYSTIRITYGTYSGTSMAAPHVSGALALLKSQFPELTASQLKERLLATVDPLPSLAGKTVTGGRLNLWRLLGGNPVSSPYDTLPPTGEGTVITGCGFDNWQSGQTYTLATDFTPEAVYSILGPCQSACLEIDVPDVTIDCQEKYINGFYSAITLIADRTTIKNCVFKDNSRAIQIGYSYNPSGGVESSNNIIINNLFDGNEYSLLFPGSPNSCVTSNDNFIDNNKIINGLQGLNLASSCADNNIISNNFVCSNNANFWCASGSSGNSGSGNTLAYYPSNQMENPVALSSSPYPTFTTCYNGWPALGTNYELCPPSPVADPGGPYYQESLTVNFDGSGSYNLVEGTLLYEWDFGDGTQSNEVAPVHTYSKQGNYAVKLKVKNEQTSLDSSVKQVTVSLGYEDLLDVAQYGVATIDSNWKTITLREAADWVIIATPISDNDPDSGHVRIKDVTSMSFQIKVEEWSYQDGIHGEELVSWLAIKKGAHTLRGDTSMLLIADKSTYPEKSLLVDGIGSNDGFIIPTEYSDLMGYTNLADGWNFIPQFQTANGASVVIYSMGTITALSGEDKPIIVAIGEQKYPNTGSRIHPSEEFGYLVFKSGTTQLGPNTGVKASTTPDSVLTHDWYNLNFNDFGSYEDTLPIISYQFWRSGNDREVMDLRYRNLDTSSIDLRSQEETSYDSDLTRSVPERINYIIIKTNQDIIAPLGITTLSSTSVTGTSVNLQWTAVGDDGNVGTATSYDLRYSTSPITESNFNSVTEASGEPAPQISGSLESFTVSGLNSETTYYFAIKAVDEASNAGAISNMISASISDVVAPSPITTLYITLVSGTSVRLRWTAVGDDGNVGTATSYDLRYSTSPITEFNFNSATEAFGEPVPQPSGSFYPETFTVSGLNYGTPYYFSVKAVDEVGNVGTISNIISVSTLYKYFSLIPNGQGNWQAWTNVGCSSGTNEWQCVDEALANTGDYLYSTGNNKETFTFSDLSGVLTVKSIMLNYYASRYSSSDACFEAMIRSNGIDYSSGVQKCLGSSWATVYQSYTTNPATGSAWTIAEVNALEAGMKGLDPNGGGKVSQVKAVVSYIPSACADGIDNDNEGLIDYPSDPGCSNIDDNSE